MTGRLFAISCLCVVVGAAPAAEKSEKLALQFVDGKGRTVPNVTVGTRWELAALNALAGGKLPQPRWRVDLGTFQTIKSDASGVAMIDVDALFPRSPLKSSTTLYALSADARLSAVINVPREDAAKPMKVTLAPACRVKLKFISSDLKAAGREFDRTIVSIFAGSDKIIYIINRSGEFEFVLPPGKYGLSASGRGSSGASIQPQHQTLEIPEGKSSLVLDSIDLHTGKLADLLGKPAPELSGIIAWKGGEAVALAELRGKVVVLDFWNYACSICCEEMPKLFELQKKYGNDGLVVIGVHDRTASSIEEMDRKSLRWKTGPWKNQDPPYRIALEGRGPNGTFEAFGITAVPEMVLIDRQGNLVAEFGTPSEPEFLEALQKALSVR
jgi:thiol-disulfide isomerase/thioredoxin